MEQLKTFIRKPGVLSTGIGVVSFGGGLAVGYILAKKRFQTETVVEVAEEITQLEFDFDAEGQEEYHRITQGYISGVELNHPDVDEDEDEEPVVNNVFTIPVVDANWDYDAEVDSRKSKQIYVIHKDEFDNDEMEWDNQSTLTFYDQDEVLCDESDVPIINGFEIIRELRFGHGSGDPNVCFIRDEKREVEYEVLRERGSYEIIVLGGELQAEIEAQDLRHSRHPTKFRID